MLLPAALGWSDLVLRDAGCRPYPDCKSKGCAGRQWPGADVDASSRGGRARRQIGFPHNPQPRTALEIYLDNCLIVVIALVGTVEIGRSCCVRPKCTCGYPVGRMGTAQQALWTGRSSPQSHTTHPHPSPQVSHTFKRFPQAYPQPVHENGYRRGQSWGYRGGLAAGRAGSQCDCRYPAVYGGHPHRVERGPPLINPHSPNS